MGEAQLLESSALNYLRHSPAKSRTSRSSARVSLRRGGRGQFRACARGLLRGFRGELRRRFRASAGACCAARTRRVPALRPGELGGTRGSRARDGPLHRESLSTPRFISSMRALVSLHPELDEAAYASTLVNRALRSSSRAARCREGDYAKALGFARRLNSKIAVRSPSATASRRSSFAEGPVLEGPQFLPRSLRRTRATQGVEQRVLSAELRVAECLGRLGQQRGDAHARSRSSARDRRSFGRIRARPPGALRSGRRGRRLQRVGRSRCRIPRGARPRRSEGVQAVQAGGERQLIFL